jgi:hypothetical protein
MMDRLEAVAKAHAIVTRPLAGDPQVEESDREAARVFLAMLDAAQGRLDAGAVARRLPAAAEETNAWASLNAGQGKMPEDWRSYHTAGCDVHAGGSCSCSIDDRCALARALYDRASAERDAARAWASFNEVADRAMGFKRVLGTTPDRRGLTPMTDPRGPTAPDRR